MVASQYLSLPAYGFGPMLVLCYQLTDPLAIPNNLTRLVHKMIEVSAAPLIGLRPMLIIDLFSHSCRR